MKRLLLIVVLLLLLPACAEVQDRPLYQGDDFYAGNARGS